MSTVSDVEKKHRICDMRYAIISSSGLVHQMATSSLVPYNGSIQYTAAIYFSAIPILPELGIDH